MKKRMIMLFMALYFTMVSCGNNTAQAENDKNEQNEESKNKSDSVEQYAEPEYIDGFEKAEYDKFNSYASENGLGDTLVYIEGKVLNQTKKEETLSMIIEQEDGNRWVAVIMSESQIEGIEDKNVRIFGAYWGFSDVFNVPAIGVAADDTDLMSKCRIEEKDGSTYKIVWNFWDDYAEKELEKQNKEEAKEEPTFDMIDNFSYNYDENNSITVGIMKDKETGNLSVSVLAKYEADNLGLMQFNWTEIIIYPLINGFDLSFGASVGEEYYYYFLNDGKIVLDNITAEVAEFPRKYEESAKEVMKMVDDLYVKYGIKEKTYNELVYEDEKVKIYFAGVGTKGVEFWVENLTDINITIQADSVAINGISTNSIMMSDDVAPKSKGKVIAKCKDFTEGMEVQKVGGQLRVIDFSGGWKTYNATFSNIEIE